MLIFTYWISGLTNLTLSSYVLRGHLGFSTGCIGLMTNDVLCLGRPLSLPTFSLIKHVSFYLRHKTTYGFYIAFSLSVTWNCHLQSSQKYLCGELSSCQATRRLKQTENYLEVLFGPDLKTRLEDWHYLLKMIIWISCVSWTSGGISLLTLFRSDGRVIQLNFIF